MNKGYSDMGFVLARRNFGEADRIVSVFSKNHGRISLLAKGVRKTSSRKRGHLETFNLIKFQAATTKGIDVISEAEVIEDYSYLKTNLQKVAVAYFVNEAVGKTTQEKERNVNIYNLIGSVFREIAVSDNLKTIRHSFIKELLSLLGYWPKGKSLPKPDEKLQEIIERQMYSLRIGKKIQ